MYIFLNIVCFLTVGTTAGALSDCVSTFKVGPYSQLVFICFFVGVILPIYIPHFIITVSPPVLFIVF